MSHHPLTIEIRPGASTVTLALAGELDLGSAGTLRTCFEQLDDGYDEVIVDLGDLRFLDSTGLSLFLQTEHSLRERARPCRLVLRSPRPQVRKVLEVSGIDRLVTVVV